MSGYFLIGQKGKTAFFLMDANKNLGRTISQKLAIVIGESKAL